MLELRLQFFAKEGPGGEKTEEPTSKKLQDARKEGQVAKSKEIANAFMLVTAFLLLQLTVKFLLTEFLNVFELIYNSIPQAVINYGGLVAVGEINGLVFQMLLHILIMLIPFLVVGFIVAFLADFIQVKWEITTKPLQPKLDRLSPLSGFKRIFSMNSIVELIKSILKIGVVSYVAYSTLKKEHDVITLLFKMPLMQGVSVSCQLAVELGLKCSLVYFVIAVVDLVYQKRKFKKDQMMTKQEIKEEFKQSEGDPQIKGKIRQRMREASQRRMMQELPKADVVITNPTHYAVAVKYDTNISSAPIVVAKGENYLAARIKEVAKEHHIEIVENKPLARMLYHNVEVNEQIPEELYQAVAEVLAMVYHIQGKV